MKKAKEILLSVLLVVFAMAAGAASYHQYIKVVDKPNKSKIAPVQPSEAAQAAGAAEPKEIFIQPVEEERSYYDSLELLAICVEAEAGDQSLEGKRMVADVILNRVDDRDFPDTIEGVISQKYQFSSYWDGRMDQITEPSEETIKAVQMELNNRGWPGLIYFRTDGISVYGTPWKRVGDHYFSTK